MKSKEISRHQGCPARSRLSRATWRGGKMKSQSWMQKVIVLYCIVLYCTVLYQTCTPYYFSEKSFGASFGPWKCLNFFQNFLF